MKNLFRVLFKVLFFIPRLLVSIIWAVFKSVLILAVVTLAFLYLSQGSFPDFSQVRENFGQQVEQFLGNRLLDAPTSLDVLETDRYEASGQSRWQTSQASVYIASTDPTLVSAYETAISNWNATGAFTFNLTSNEKEADIIATDHSDATTQAAGVAESESNVLTHQLRHVDVKLNTYYLLNEAYGYDFERIVHTAEHELGHAIGLDHDDSGISVMQSAGSNYGIQDSDIAAVRVLYQ